MYRVLIAEDDVAIRFYYKMMKTWTECGFTIAGEEGDGHHAAERLKKESFDLIFTDIRMPFMDGVELLEHIRNEGITTPVVFASSYSDFQYAQKGIVYGLFDYILKPVDEKKLAEVLLRVKKKLDEESEKKLDNVMTALLNEMGVSADNEFVKKMAVYCSENYTDFLASDDVADMFGVRKDYFGKLFKQHFNIPYSEFRSKVKFAYAIELMKTGNYMAYEVSDMLGFSSYQYFSKNFKAVTGKNLSDFKIVKK